MPTDTSLKPLTPSSKPSNGSGSGSGSYFPRPLTRAVSSTWRRWSAHPTSSSRSSSKAPTSRTESPARHPQADVAAARAQNNNNNSSSNSDSRAMPPLPSHSSSAADPYANLIDLDSSDRGDYDEDLDGEDDFQDLPPPPPIHAVAAPSRVSSYSPSPRPAPPPFSPPPLTPLTLSGIGDPGALQSKAQILSRLIAEEIRLLLPGRLELVDTWRLAFSLEQDGASLATLYEKCDEYRARRGGFVLVVRDASGGIFGAYLSDPPAPSKGHYYGTGECFLWRSAVLSSSVLPSLASLPPPPSEDTTHATRTTTLGLPARLRQHTSNNNGSNDTNTGTSTPERIRFKAFPYSGENDYMIFCEGGFLSVGGGDGQYGLWLDAALENGVSGRCMTFGNEPLSEDGAKFDVIGVEAWYVGA